MLLEAWHLGQKWLTLDDSQFDEAYCTKTESKISDKAYSASQITISMKDCFVMYAFHKTIEAQVVQSRQDTDIAILSFQLSGHMAVNEKDFEPYRIFEDDLHITFFTNKRELVFEVPSVFENFRVILSPAKFQELLAKYHGRFSTYSEKINRGDYFNLFEEPLPVTPKMKLIIRDILAHTVVDPILSKVYFETKITELFGLQLEQMLSTNEAHSSELSAADRKKIEEIRQLLVCNLANDPPPIAKLARLVATNESKLKKGFKEIYGTSIYNYLILCRIEKAIELMDDENLLLDDIAVQVGYADAAHFSRAFRKVKGFPPGQFRKMNKR